MDYVLPQVRVFQEAALAPAATERRLPAHVAGGHAWLVRYTDDDERPRGQLGYYDDAVDTDYAWPNRPAGALVDTGYTKLFIKDALLRYFSDGAGTGRSIVKQSGYNNRLYASGTVFKEGNDYDRSPVFYDRDVAVGDVAKVRAVDGGGDPVTLWTYVKAVLPEEIAATINSASSDSANAAAQGASVVANRTAGQANCVNAVPNADSYDGLAAGYVTETYRVLVVEGSIGSDHTTARLRIISGSGTDNVDEVVPPLMNEDFAVGTRGLIMRFTDTDSPTCSESAVADGYTADDLVAGQEWTITVRQAHTPATAVSSGTYDGTASVTYIVQVTTGGAWADGPRVTVTSTDGTDASGPTLVEEGVEFDIGTRGAALSISGGAGLRKGDKYYVEVTGQSDGAHRTIVLGHALSTEIAADTEVDLTLYIRVPDLEVPANRAGAAPLTNFDQSATEITVNSGITVYHDEWTDSGVPLALDVVSEEGQAYGLVYAHYRAWLPDFVNRIEVATAGDYATLISGADHPDNPLKYGVGKAIANSNGTPVRFSAVGDPDELESWEAVLEKLVGFDGPYGLVPLTKSREVLEAYKGHVLSMSNETNNLWRVGWFSLSGLPEIPVVHAGSSVTGHVAASTADGEVCLCVVEDDPSTSGTQYTRVRCTSENGQFVTLGVRPGDTVRLAYTSDGFGGFNYATYTVDSVVSEDELLLADGLDAPITVAAKTEVWRTLTATEEATAIGVSAGAWASKRIMAVWPDTIEAAGTVVEGYFLCAALAGFASGVLPQRGLTHASVSGFTAVPRSTGKFNRQQLDVMAGAGAFIVDQDLSGLATSLGDIYVRHGMTTYGYSDQTLREEAITRNVDSISYRFRETFAPYIGRVNVTPGTRQRLQLEADALVETLKGENAPADLGGQLLSGTTVNVRNHTLFRDRFVVDVAAVIPYALNNVDVHIQF